MSSPKRAKYSTKDDGTNENEYLKSLQAIEVLQEEMNNMREKCDQEAVKLEKKLEMDKKPIYDKREEAISLIPNFWVTALMNHPDISALLDESEEEYLLYLSKIEVQIVEEFACSFKIIFHFKENPYFKNTSLIKEYVQEYQNSRILKKVTASTIIWKDGQDISQKLKERKSFLFWLTSQDFGMADSRADFDIAQVIKEDLWINPLPYFLLSDNEQEDNSDEDEDSEDDVLIIEDSDEEKSTAAEPDEEESENETEEYDSPASSEVTQNEN